jgi:RNA polymerase sigma-70 factor (ECF subfamily)
VPLDSRRGWLFRVAHNLALKRRYRTRRDTQPYSETEVDPEPNPEDRLQASQTRERLLAVVAASSEQDRRCLYLRAEGLRYREIAEVPGMSLGAVSMSLSRSLARMARYAERNGL